MVLLKMLMEISLPKMGELLLMMMTMISPSGREVPPAESLPRREKVLLPKFRLETVVLHPESPLFTFSRSKYLYARRWAPEVGLGEHNPSGRAREPPLVLIDSKHSYLFHKKSSWSFSSFGVVQNRWPDVAFPGPDFQLPEFSLFVWTFQIMR